MIRYITITFLFFILIAAPGHSFDLNDVAKGIEVINELSKQQRDSQQQGPQKQQTQQGTQPTQDVQPDGRIVRQVQSELSDLGYAPGPIDGLMGTRTEQAIREFQSAIGVPVTGRPSRSLLKMIQSERQSGAAQTTAGYAPTPSFDCARARTSTERAICQSQTLAGYDRDIAQSFSAARENLGAADADDLLQEQRVWLNVRNACGGNHTCLEKTMHKRAQFLNRVAASGFANTTTNAHAATSTIKAQDDLPLFFITDHFTSRADAKHLADLRENIVTRLEYAANAQMIADTDALLRLLDTLPDQDIDALIYTVHDGEPPDILLNNLAATRRANGPSLSSISRLLWDNEFDRQLFLSEARALVEARIPHDQLSNTVRVRLVCSVSFDEFDFDKQVFPLKTTSCGPRRLDLTGRSVLAEYRSGPGAGAVAMDVPQARAFSEQLGSRRQVLVSSPATLSIQNDGTVARLIMEEDGPPSLHPMMSLEKVLYTYPASHASGGELVSADLGQVSGVAPASEGLERIPAEFFVLRLAPDVLNEDQWLQLTQRQIRYDQEKNGPSVFPASQVRGRKPSFAAPEFVEAYKAEVSRLLSGLKPSAVTRLEVRPEWMGYHDGKLTSSQTNWGYMREINHSHSRFQALAQQMGKAAVFGENRLHQNFNVKDLPRSLVHDLRPHIRTVMFVTDRLPRIPELPMEASKAESLFLQNNCLQERDTLENLMQDGSGASAYAIDSANKTYYACLERRNDLPEDFVFDIWMEFDGAQRNSQGFFVETRLVRADLYDLKGAKFATIGPEDFPSGETKAHQAVKQSEESDTTQSAANAPDASAPSLQNPDIVGLKLGMSLDEAEQVVRSHFDKIDAIVERRMVNNVFANSIAYGNSATGEAIAVYYQPERPDEGVIAVTRTLELPGQRPNAAQYRKLISDKYGVEDSNWGSQLRINDAGHRNCLPLYPTSLGRYVPNGLNETWRQGTRTQIGWKLFSNILSLPFPTSEVERRMMLEEADCVPTLAVKFFSTNDDLTIHTLLVDATLPREAMRKALTAETEKVKTKF